MNIADVMDEVAERLRTIPSLAGKRTYESPPDAPPLGPAAVVSYPDEIEYDKTYGRGMDRITGEVVVIIGRPGERQTRTLLAGYLDGSGPESVKATLDGTNYASCDSVRVASGIFDTVKIGGTDFLAGVFSIDIAGRGART